MKVGHIWLVGPDSNRAWACAVEIREDPLPYALIRDSPTSLGRSGVVQVKNLDPPSGGVPALTGAGSSRLRRRGAPVSGGRAVLPVAPCAFYCCDLGLGLGDCNLQWSFDAPFLHTATWIVPPRSSKVGLSGLKVGAYLEVTCPPIWRPPQLVLSSEGLQPSVGGHFCHSSPKSGEADRPDTS